VLRLTLLFFGAAKDVPEAAKMVTAGTACLHSHANYRPNLTGLEYYRRRKPARAPPVWDNRDGLPDGQTAATD
jgi:hypothetical protein